jgi:3-methyl-2-oxobutanoate hydroxymethyltransferase
MIPSEKITLTKLIAKKRKGEKISVLTAYDHPTAEVEQEAGVDAILVGDSLAQTLLGHDSTIPATMDLMVTLTAAVRRGAPRVFLIADMPFLSYHLSDAQAIENAGRFMVDARCDCVKVECDGRWADRIEAMSRAAIPVMAHLGLRPQAREQIGGKYVTQARDADSAVELVRDARRMEEAGAVALLLEAVPPEPAQAVSKAVSAPVIGCGAGPYVDGHVVVHYEMLGLLEGRSPRFVRRYSALRGEMSTAVRRYVEDVASGNYPSADECYKMKKGEAESFAHHLGRLHGHPSDGQITASADPVDS